MSIFSENMEAAATNPSEVKKEEEIKETPEEEVIDIDLKDPEVDEAAKKIQAAFKANKARKKV